MRIVHLALTLLLCAIPTAAGAGTPAEPPNAGPVAFSLPRPARLPEGRTYAGAVFVTGGARGHVVIAEGPDAARPARWTGLDDDGRVLWEADHACPDFQDLATLLAPTGADRVVCKLRSTIVGVDLATGQEAWRFTDPQPLYMTVTAGGRVATSVDNAQVAVLDGASGAELARYDVGGGVLEAAAETATGPVALLVVDSPAVEVSSIDLPTGLDGALESIPVAGDDPGRRLMAIAIGGPARSGVGPPTVRWSVPFVGYSFDLHPSAGAVVGQPSEGRTTAFGLGDGRVLWERPLNEDEQLAWGDDGGLFARRLSGGGILYGALDARRGKTLWSATIAETSEVVGLGQGGGDLGVAWGGGFELAWFANGKAKLSRVEANGEQIVSLRSTARSVLWVTAQGESRTVRVAAVAR